MFQAQLLKKLFVLCSPIYIVYLINTIPTRLLSNKSPYEALNGEAPDLSTLRVFRFLCCSTTLSTHRTKFNPRVRKCVFLGIKSGTKGYAILEYVQTREIVVSRDVSFYYLQFPFHKHDPSPP